MGSGYVIDYCVAALNKKRKAEIEEARYKAYVTDALMIIAENTTHYMGASDMFDYGKTLRSRWIELMSEPKEEPKEEDTRTPEELAADIWQKMKKKKK